jgi:hypothetical protein
MHAISLNPRFGATAFYVTRDRNIGDAIFQRIPGAQIIEGNMGTQIDWKTPNKKPPAYLYTVHVPSRILERDSKQHAMDALNLTDTHLFTIADLQRKNAESRLPRQFKLIKENFLDTVEKLCEPKDTTP